MLNNEPELQTDRLPQIPIGIYLALPVGGPNGDLHIHA